MLEIYQTMTWIDWSLLIVASYLLALFHTKQKKETNND